MMHLGSYSRIPVTHIPLGREVNLDNVWYRLMRKELVELETGQFVHLTFKNHPRTVICFPDQKLMYR